MNFQRLIIKHREKMALVLALILALKRWSIGLFGLFGLFGLLVYLVGLFITWSISQMASGTGRFELQVVEIQNQFSQINSGSCCSGDRSGSSKCPDTCQTAVALCLMAYQSASPSHWVGGVEPRPRVSDCTYGREVSTVLGSSSFTIARPPSNGHLFLPIKFSWTVSMLMLKYI